MIVFGMQGGLGEYNGGVVGRVRVGIVKMGKGEEEKGMEGMEGEGARRDVEVVSVVRLDDEGFGEECIGDDDGDGDAKVSDVEASGMDDSGAQWYGVDCVDVEDCNVVVSDIEGIDIETLDDKAFNVGAIDNKVLGIEDIFSVEGSHGKIFDIELLMPLMDDLADS